MEEMRTPALRFRGYHDAWKNRKLGELYTERDERGDDSLKILSVSIHHGVSSEELDSDSLGKKVRRSEDKSLYKHVYPGDFVLNMMRAWQGAIGVVRSEGMISPAYIAAVPSDQLYPLFMDFCLGREESIRQMNNLSYGVTDFRKRLYWDSFIRVMCHIPSVPEQEMITTFLTHLDNLIDQHQRKYVKLQNLKSAMLEKMFPKDGADVPEIRFKGFTGRWEIQNLSKIGDTYTGLSGKTKDDFGHGGARYITYINVNKNPIAKLDGTACIEIDNKQNEVEYGDALFTTSSETPEEVGMPSIWLGRTRNVYLNSFCFGFRLFEPLDPYFFAYLLRSPSVRRKFIILAQGISRYNTSKTKTKEIGVAIPAKDDEQKRIGEFFKQIDDLIEGTQDTTEKLRKIRLAILNRMFV